MLAQRRRGHAERLQQISGDHRDPRTCALGQPLPEPVRRGGRQADDAPDEHFVGLPFGPRAHHHHDEGGRDDVPEAQPAVGQQQPAQRPGTCAGRGPGGGRHQRRSARAPGVAQAQRGPCQQRRDQSQRSPGARARSACAGHDLDDGRRQRDACADACVEGGEQAGPSMRTQDVEHDRRPLDHHEGTGHARQRAGQRQQPGGHEHGQRKGRQDRQADRRGVGRAAPVRGDPAGGQRADQIAGEVGRRDVAGRPQAQPGLLDQGRQQRRVREAPDAHAQREGREARERGPMGADHLRGPTPTPRSCPRSS